MSRISTADVGPEGVVIQERRVDLELRAVIEALDEQHRERMIRLARRTVEVEHALRDLTDAVAPLLIAHDDDARCARMARVREAYVAAIEV